jgi:hypothetical protein
MDPAFGPQNYMSMIWGEAARECGVSRNCNKYVVKDVECAVKKVATLAGQLS